MTPSTHISDSDLAAVLSPEVLPSVEERLLLEEILSRTTQTAKTIHYAGYELDRLPLGRGATGCVIAARHSVTNKRVALKILDRRTSLTSEVFARDDVMREAKMMAGVIHRNVVTVHRVGFDEGQAWIAMDLVEGVTLRSWQREKRPWSDVLAAYVAAGRGLAAAHRQGIIHGDFKPDNVLVDGKGTPTLTDFGLATLDDDHTSLGGTPQYMAPEQFAESPTRDARSEQFTFCVALFEAMTGSHPYVSQNLDELASTVREVSGEVTPRSLHSRFRHEFLHNVHNGSLSWPRLPVKIPRRVRSGLVRGLDPSPARRFPSMESLLDTLDLPRVRKRRRALAGVATLGLVAGAAGAFAYDHNDRIAECRDPGGRFDEVWDSSAKAALDEHHPGSAEEVGLVVSRLKERWSGAYAWSCERTAKHGDWDRWKPVRSCLKGQLNSLELFVEELPKLNTEAVREVARGLTTRSPDSCALWDSWETGEGLRRELQRAEFLGWSHSFDAAIESVEGVIHDSRERGAKALLAEAYKVRGALRVERSIRKDKDHLGPAAPGMSDLRRAELAALAADAPAVAIDAWIVRARALAVMHDKSPRTPLSLDFLREITAEDGRIGRLLKDQEANLIDIRGLELYNDGLRDVAGAFENARTALEEAIERYERHGDRYAAARAQENLGKVLVKLGSTEEAVERLNAAQSYWSGGRKNPDRAGLIAELIGAYDQPTAQQLSDEELADVTYTSDERLVLMLPSIYAYWGEPRAYELALQAMALVEDPDVKATDLHRIQVRVAALGALALDERATAHIDELERWADEVSKMWCSAPTDTWRVLALAYVGRARLVEQKYSEARDRFEACRAHIGWQGQNPETKAQVYLDLAESLNALGHHTLAHDHLNTAAEFLSKVDDPKERGAFELRLRNLRTTFESSTSP